MRSNQGRSWSHLHQLPFDQTLISTRLLPTTLFHIFTLSKVLNLFQLTVRPHTLSISSLQKVLSTNLLLLLLHIAQLPGTTLYGGLALFCWFCFALLLLQI